MVQLQSIFPAPLPGAARDPDRIREAIAHTPGHQPSFAAVFAGEADAWQLTLDPHVNPAAIGLVGHPAVLRLDVTLLHDGYLDAAMRNKRGRNDALLRRALAEQPHDAYLHYQLGKDLELRGAYDSALPHYMPLFALNHRGVQVFASPYAMRPLHESETIAPATEDSIDTAGGSIGDAPFLM